VSCREIQPLAETFIDGELTPEQTLRVEAHLDGCESCAEQVALLDALRVSTQRAVLEDVTVSPAFEQRVRDALETERRLELERAHSTVWGRRFSGTIRRSIAPLLAAAAVLLWLAFRPEVDASAEMKEVVANADMGIDQALDRLIDYHSAPPPAQVTSADELPLFDRDVGVRVHAPSLHKWGAHWEGASLVSVRNHQAASLRYRMPGRRMTVYVYDPRKVSVHGSLPKRLVGNAPVYVGEWRGYTVAAKENHGIGYAMASDLDDATTAELVTEIH
jgi:anti-sigma factor RsiW